MKMCSKRSLDSPSTFPYSTECQPSCFWAWEKKSKISPTLFLEHCAWSFGSYLSKTFVASIKQWPVNAWNNSMVNNWQRKRRVASFQTFNYRKAHKKSAHRPVPWTCQMWEVRNRNRLNPRECTAGRRTTTRMAEWALSSTTKTN